MTIAYETFDEINQVKSFSFLNCIHVYEYCLFTAVDVEMLSLLTCHFVFRISVYVLRYIFLFMLLLVFIVVFIFQKPWSFAFNKLLEKQ